MRSPPAPEAVVWRHTWLPAAVAAVFLLLAVAVALARRPECDEGWFANPAYTLATRGYMGSPVLEPANTFTGGVTYRGIDRHTYWIMPLNPLLQAAVYKVFGFSLLAMRAISMAWGLVALAAWYLLLRKLAPDRRVAGLGVVLIAFDYAFIRGASQGRMDMMCASLTFTAFAAYLYLRETNLDRAVLVSHVLAAAAVFTHPCGALAVLNLVVLTIWFDRRRVGLSHLFLGLVPYAAGVAGWGLYAAQDPASFWAQFRGNAAGRLWALRAPLKGLQAELVARYLGAGAGPWFKALLPWPYLAGVAGSLAAGPLRRERGYRVLLVMAAIDFVYFWLLEGTKLYLYVVHIAPVCMSLLAAWIYWLWDHGWVPRWMIAAGVCGVLVMEIGGTGVVVRRNTYGRNFLPAARFLEGHARKQDLIVGSAEMGFPLRFPENLLDDVRLGYAGGKVPAYVVVEEKYAAWFLGTRSQPALYRYTTNFLENDCSLVYDRANYRIYRRKGLE